MGESRRWPFQAKNRSSTSKSYYNNIMFMVKVVAKERTVMGIVVVTL